MLVVPFLVYAVATVVFTWPLASVMTTSFVGADGRLAHDVPLVLWILRWGLHALATQPTAFFDGNVFHPTPRVLTTTEHLLGLQPLFAPVWLVSDNPVLALNVASMASFVLAGLAMHALVLRWTASRAAAYASGLAFAFAPWRFGYLGALHLLHVQYLPLIALGVGAILDGARTRVALATGALIALQCLCSYYIGYMVLTLVAAVALGDVVARGWHGRRRELASLGLALVVALAVVVPVSLPYLRSGGAGGLVFERKDFFMEMQAAAASPLPLARGKVGIEVTVAALLALPLLVTLRRDRVRLGRVLGLVITAGLAFVITGGPDAPAGALYRALSAVVPGFDRVRSPSRFVFLLSFAFSALAGFAIATVAAERGRRRVAALVIAAVVMASPLRVWWTAERLEPARVPTGADVPEVYRWLAEHGEGGPVLDVIPEGVDEGTDAALAMYYSTYHWLPILIGHTGYYPLYYFPFLRPLLNQLPQPDVLALVVRCTGVRWIVLPANSDRRAAWSRTAGVRLRNTFDSHVLFEMQHPETDVCRRRLFSRDTTMDGTPLGGPLDLSGTLGVGGVGAVLVARGESRVTIALHSTSPTTWTCTGVLPEGRIELEVRWLDPDARAAPLRPQRVLIPRDVAPNQFMAFGAWLVHPRKPGSYRLRVTAHRADTPDGPALVWEREVGVRRPGAAHSRVQPVPSWKRAVRDARSGTHASTAFPTTFDLTGSISGPRSRRQDS